MARVTQYFKINLNPNYRLWGGSQSVLITAEILPLSSVCIFQFKTPNHSFLACNSVCVRLCVSMVKGSAVLQLLLLALVATVAVLPVRSARSVKLGDGEPAELQHATEASMALDIVKDHGFQAAACAILGLFCEREQQALTCTAAWEIATDGCDNCCSGDCDGFSLICA